MLETRNVSFQVGESLLVDDVSLRLEPGEVLSVVGPNGAGKSTLLRLLSGEVRPTSGEVLLDGEPLERLKPRDVALRRAVLPQQTLLQFAFTARDVVLMGRNPHLKGSWPAQEDFRIADSALASTQMSHQAGRAFPTLSGGEQARVTFARVLAQEAPMLLLDEPTSSLDIKHQEMVMRLARSLARGGTAVLVIIHDLNLAAAYSDRIALMARGRLVAFGPTSDVMQPDLLSDAFDCPLRVVNDGSGAPMVVPWRETCGGAGNGGEECEPVTRIRLPRRNGAALQTEHS